MSDMLGRSLSAAFSSPLYVLARLFYRWVALLGRQSALSHDPDVDAYTLLTRFRRQHAASCRQSVIIRLPNCIDDAQVSLRITM
jgi:hypothetical protein